jgi:mRNA interferase HigB
LFPAVDGGVRVRSGGTVSVFDVSGNKYRMIVAISYEKQLVRIFELLTHSEYSKDLWKERY